MRDLPVGTLLSVTFTSGHTELATIVAGTDYFSFVIKREDNHTQRLHATNIATFFHDIPYVIVPFSEIDNPLSYDTQLPVSLEGNWFPLCYYASPSEGITSYWRRYREMYPLDRYGVIWNYAASTSGFLSPEEIEHYLTLESIEV